MVIYAYRYEKFNKLKTGIPPMNPDDLVCTGDEDFHSAEVTCSANGFGISVPLCTYKSLNYLHLIDGGMYLTGSPQPTQCFGTRKVIYI